ncbi:MAG: TonB family protein [Bacteroidia bacterium]
MSSKNIKIFDETGCLSEEALTEYAHGKLDIHLRKQVEIHANECDFCRDALEGISLMKSKEASRFAVAQLNAKISGKGDIKPTGGKVIQMHFLRLAAAVLLFFVLGGGVLYLALNPPFKNEVASNKSEEKVLADNKAPVNTNGVVTDSIVANGFIAQPPPDASVVSALPVEEGLRKEQDNTIAQPITGTGGALAETTTAEDLEIDDYNKMTATGGASNAAPTYYNPQSDANQQPTLFNSEKYVSDGIAGNDNDDESAKNLSSVEIASSKSKAADKKAQKEAEKRSREELASKTVTAQEAPSVAYDALKVAEEKQEVDQARRKVEDEAGTKNDDTKVYAFAEEMPQYPGGNEALKKHIRDNVKYPQTAKEQAVSGTVYISYVVNAAGKVTNVKVWKSVSKDLDNEAVRVVSSLKDFTPGKQEGKQVSVQMTIPVKFSLE